MWEKILNLEAINFITKVSDEDIDKVAILFDILKQRIEDYDVIVTVAKKWDTFEDTKQAKIALNYAGMFHASRFIILMDYLNMKYKKGEL